MALIIVAPKPGLYRYRIFHITLSIFKHSYIFLINMKYLGKPNPDKWKFLYIAYKLVFTADLPYMYRLFFYLFGKYLMHIFKYDNQKVGFALFRIFGPIKNIYLCSLGILESFRGKGLAKPLLAQSMDYWKRKGYKTISVYVLYNNKIAIRVYESLGFSCDHYQDDLIYMVKQL